MGLDMKRLMRKLPEDQRRSMFAASWFGTGSKHLQFFPAQVYQKTFDLLDKAIERDFSVMDSLRLELFEKDSFYAPHKAESPEEKKEFEKMRLIFSVAYGHHKILNTDIAFFELIKKELKEQEAEQFASLEAQFGL